MKTSLSWLRDFVDIPWEPRELAARLTAAGLEVEGIEEIGKIPAGVVVAEILERRPHENSDHLSVCQVSTGSGEKLQIVCGAPNCDAGQRVPLAGVGTDFGDGFVIKKAKLRGVESQGMLCSAKELGLSDEHLGLLILPPDAPLGTPLSDLYPTDVVIDWEVTPNRPDWLSHLGIAREIAALTGGELRLPESELCVTLDCNADQAAKVTLQAPDLCPRYIARVFRGVKIGPSPDWLVRRLEAVGLRSVNNVVDITNYVMLEYGQPLHAFDLETLAGREIIVRRAEQGESIVTLDGTKLSLQNDNLLIADQSRGVALAGIMGAENSMITDQTTTVLLEAAAFNRSNIRLSSRNLEKATDSSYIFERGVSPEMTALASVRAAGLLCALAGAEQLAGVIDCYPEPWRSQQITCRLARVNALLGLSLTAEELADCFQRRGITVTANDGQVLTVKTPYWRFDLHSEIDLVEEAAQMRGLDAIPEAPAIARLGGSAKEDTFYPLEEVRDQLQALGLDEIVNYSLWSLPQCLAGTALQEEDILRVSNPISQDTACLRPNLLAGLLQVVNHNVSRNQHDLAIFEIGRVFRLCAGAKQETTQIGLALSGRCHPERYGAELTAEHDFFSLKGLLESFLASRRQGDYVCEPIRHPAFKEGAAARILVQGQEVLVFGEAATALSKGIRLRYPLFLALLDWEALQSLPPAVPKYAELPQFPGTARDISFVAPGGLTHQAIVDKVCSLKLPLLQKVELFDIFEDAKVLGEGRRSMSYSLTFRDPKRTLTDDEVNQLQEKIRRTLEKDLAVELR
ncbi:MAG: phenylalanine--tRNA ligase subunit beta [Oligosphaeraceae bacterium]|nr:phenylalanine--tRNA ligase subunit beta [Oligosphaeraceae bacterium]